MFGGRHFSPRHFGGPHFAPLTFPWMKRVGGGSDESDDGFDQYDYDQWWEARIQHARSHTPEPEPVLEAVRHGEVSITPAFYSDAAAHAPNAGLLVVNRPPAPEETGDLTPEELQAIAIALVESGQL